MPKYKKFQSTEEQFQSSKEKFNCIKDSKKLDPPYNIGKEFVYNDDLIASFDSYKYSKWLSFMHSRLNIARTLLNNRGVIFLSIDDSKNAIVLDFFWGSCNNNDRGKQLCKYKEFKTSTKV